MTVNNETGEINTFEVRENDTRWNHAQRQTVIGTVVAIAVLFSSSILVGGVGLARRDWIGVGVSLSMVGAGCWGLAMVTLINKTRLEKVDVGVKGISLYFRNRSAHQINWSNPKIKFTLFDYRARTVSDYYGFIKVPCRIGMGYGLISNGISAEAFEAIYSSAKGASVRIREKERLGGRSVFVGNWHWAP